MASIERKGGAIMISTPLMKKVWAKVVHWRELSRQRSQLSKMSDALLKDAGISRADAECEAERPFWDSTPVEDSSLRSRTGPVANSTPKKTNTSFTYNGAANSHSERCIS